MITALGPSDKASHLLYYHADSMPRFFDTWKKLGPGLITGASDDDPSGIATYTQVGAQFGLGQIWSASLFIPFMIAVQEMVGRIGLVAGEGLGAILRKRYPRWLLWMFVLLLLTANTINIGADLGAMADAARLLIPAVPFPVFAIGFTVLILLLQILVTYQKYARVLKWLTLSLFTYVATAFIVTTDWPDILIRALIPHFTWTHEYILGFIAILGTTISPYLMIWQGNQEVEEEIGMGRMTLHDRRGATSKEIQTMRFDTSIGMIFSQLITFFIIATASATFFSHGIHNIQTTAQAAEALRPLAGQFASLLYAVGVIGTGLLAVPILSASASYAFSEAFRWPEGLSKTFRHAHGFYGVISVSTLLGLLMNFIGINPIKALIWAAILNGLVTPVLILIILSVANNKQVMGSFVNGRLSNTMGGVVCASMVIAILLLFVL
jgi:NRAMP (natural resistance-associated macrophage protein)-like metal ion transporter